MAEIKMLVCCGFHFLFECLEWALFVGDLLDCKILCADYALMLSFVIRIQKVSS